MPLGQDGRMTQPLRLAAAAAMLLSVKGYNTTGARCREPAFDNESFVGEYALHVDSLLTFAFLVFFMQAGFVCMEAGMGRAKNVRNILLKNLLNIMIAGLLWWVCGYAFAYGRTAGGAIGASHFFTDSSHLTTKPWFITWAFCITSIAVAQGSLAERTRLVAYPCATLLLTVLVHPLAAHWVWQPGSWLHRPPCVMLDFAGGLVVHVVGGAVGLAGAAACGPRLGRFPQPGEGGPCAKELPGHNMSFVGLGTYFLFFGWLGFNCGSVYAYAATEYGFLIRRVAVCMTLSPCAAGLTALLLTSWRSGTIDLVHCVNGLLSGMVISSSVAGFVEPWAAVLGGALAGLVYYAVDRLLLRLRIDDPLAAAPIHLANGLAGTLLVGLLAKPQYVAQLTGSCTPSCGGLLYGMNGGLQLGQQALGALVVSAWSAAWAAGLFWLLARQGMLRVDQATELAGIDNIDHGGPAYPEFSGLGYGGSVRSGVNYQ